jgi:hypothetical protein
MPYFLILPHPPEAAGLPGDLVEQNDTIVRESPVLIGVLLMWG